MSEIKTILLNIPEHIDQVDDNGNTILHFAAAMRHLTPSKLKEFIEFLLSMGARVDGTNNQGLSPILIAAQVSNADALGALLRNPNITFSTRSMLFHILAQSRVSGMGQYFRRLIQSGLHRGINFNRLCSHEWLNCAGSSTVSVGGLTILHEAAIADNGDVIEIILEYNLVNVNEVDDAGNTALHYAILHAQSDSHGRESEVERFPAIRAFYEKDVQNFPGCRKGSFTKLRLDSY